MYAGKRSNLWTCVLASGLIYSRVLVGLEERWKQCHCILLGKYGAFENVGYTAHIAGLPMAFFHQ
jgi:hypothetical protein